MVMFLLASGVLGLVAGAAIAASPERTPVESREARERAVEAEKRDRARREQARRSPEAVERRRRSRSAFRGRDRASVLALARERFKRLIERSTDTRPSRGGIEEYFGRWAARVNVGSGEKAFVESQVPLRWPDRSGRLEPVDLSLEAKGDGFSPRNGPVAVSVPQNANGALQLGDALGVRAAGSASVDGVSSGATRFWGNTAVDTDMWAVALPTGFELLWQLRSPASPERLAMDLDLPPGATVRLDPATGEAEVLAAGGERLASVAPPVAHDAAGVPVRAQYTLEAGRLVVEVPHRELDVEYPIAVDPTFNWWAAGQSAYTDFHRDWDHWASWQNPSSAGFTP